MDPVTIGTVLSIAITGIISWFRATKSERQKTAAEAARAQLKWVANIVVKQIETTARKRLGTGALSEENARDLLALATNRAVSMLAPQRQRIEKALGVDLLEVIRAELELALSSQRALAAAAKVTTRAAA